MRKLLRLWQRRPESALERVLRPAIPALYRLAYRLTGQESDAEDLMQELVLRVHDRVDELAAMDRPDIWLSRVLYRLYVDSYRRAKHRPAPAGDFDSGGEDASDLVAELADELNPGPARSLEQAQLTDRLMGALAALPEAQRVAVVLHDVEGYHLHEIADMTGVPVGTLKSRLHRARRQLRAWLVDGTF